VRQTLVTVDPAVAEQRLKDDKNTVIMLRDGRSTWRLRAAP